MLLKYSGVNVWFKKVLHFYFLFKLAPSKVKKTENGLLSLFLDDSHNASRYG